MFIVLVRSISGGGLAVGPFSEILLLKFEVFIPAELILSSIEFWGTRFEIPLESAVLFLSPTYFLLLSWGSSRL